MDQNPSVSWRRVLELALQNPNGGEMDNLLSLVRRTGMSKLQSLELRQAAGEMLQKYGEGLSPSAHWFVTRLQNAGYPQTYPDYLGLGVLTPCASSTCDLTRQAKNTLRLMNELSLHLLDLPELADHPAREVLEKRVQAFTEKTHAYLFSMDPVQSPSGDLVRFSLVPESDITDELIFICVLQCSELIFATARDLMALSLDWMSYGEILEVVRSLHWVNCLSELVVPLLGALSPMSKESWHQIRPLIMAPSAIQSPSFHHLNANFDELARIFKHPRFIPSQQRFLSMAQELLAEAQANFRIWERGHRAIASKYNRISQAGPKTEGLQWLERRRPPFS